MSKFGLDETEVNNMITAALEKNSKDKSDLDSNARVRLKNGIIENNKQSRLNLRTVLLEKIDALEQRVNTNGANIAKTNATVLRVLALKM